VVWCDGKGERGGWYMARHGGMMERYFGGEV